MARIRCDVANADAASAAAFDARYQANQNPKLLPLTVTMDRKPVPLGSIPPGARIVLEASWPATAAETFAYFDSATPN